MPVIVQILGSEGRGVPGMKQSERYPLSSACHLADKLERFGSIYSRGEEERKNSGPHLQDCEV